MSGLEARNASVERGGRAILSGGSITIAPGELMVLVGPNGSGKSTLLRTLAGLWPAKSGSIELDGRPIHALPRNEVARRIAFVPQETHIDFAFTVAEILAMGRYPHRGRFAPETQADRAAVQHAANCCDITNLLYRSINTLSGGERQRALIARSLAVAPEFILLDEPTANLDVEHSLEILELCSSLAAKGQAVVLASHDLNAVTRHATRLALLRAGRIIAIGSREEVLTPDVLEEVFNVKAELVPTRDGHPLYVFHRRAERPITPGIEQAF